VDSACSKYSEYSKWAALPSVVSWSVCPSPPRAKFSGRRAQGALLHALESAGRRWDQLPSVVTWKAVTHSCPTKVPILAAGHARAQQEPATRGEGGAGAMGLILARGWEDRGAWSRFPSVVTWSSPQLAVRAVAAMAREGARAGGEACCRHVTLGGYETPKEGAFPVQLIGLVVTTPVHAYAPTRPRMHARTHARTHAARTHAHTHTHTQARTHARTHTHKPWHIRAHQRHTREIDRWITMSKPRLNSTPYCETEHPIQLT